ncbi:unnamed protein product [Polarella glacialis]|uniref:Uncharacterized protein n=1 Tax=Polarella glacialis TaxID=89957 RepID=A0A813LG55_POLGL|nr:unnamed protein product [Polarella glacialis]
MEDTSWGSMASMEDSDAPSSVEDEHLPAAGSMLQNPVFVRWCLSCGQEENTEARNCQRCGGRVQRHQRVLELEDEDEGPFSLRSLRDALADVSVGCSDVNSSAVLLSQQGPDPGVAVAYPALAEELASLGVTPAVQRALVSRGFITLEQIVSAVESAADPNTLAKNLGLSPAVEVLLRRFWHVAAEMRSRCEKRAARKNSLSLEGSQGPRGLGSGTSQEAVKRVRALPVVEQPQPQEGGCGSSTDTGPVTAQDEDMDGAPWVPQRRQAIEDDSDVPSDVEGLRKRAASG